MVSITDPESQREEKKLKKKLRSKKKDDSPTILLLSGESNEPFRSMEKYDQHASHEHHHIHPYGHHTFNSPYSASSIHQQHIPTAPLDPGCLVNVCKTSGLKKIQRAVKKGMDASLRGSMREIMDPFITDLSDMLSRELPPPMATRFKTDVRQMADRAYEKYNDVYDDYWDYWINNQLTWVHSSNKFVYLVSLLTTNWQSHFVCSCLMCKRGHQKRIEAKNNNWNNNPNVFFSSCLKKYKELCWCQFENKFNEICLHLKWKWVKKWICSQGIVKNRFVIIHTYLRCKSSSNNIQPDF